MRAAAIVMVMSIGIVGCASKGTETDTAPPRQEVAGVDFLTGRIKGGFAGIGGEHTGWALLVGDSGQQAREKQVEVDVSKVQAFVKAHEGQMVTAYGAFVEKRYVERGPTRVFVIERIQTCFSPQ